MQTLHTAKLKKLIGKRYRKRKGKPFVNVHLAHGALRFINFLRKMPHRLSTRIPMCIAIDEKVESSIKSSL